MVVVALDKAVGVNSALGLYVEAEGVTSTRGCPSPRPSGRRLDGGTDGDDLVRVDALVRFLARKLHTRS